MLQRLSYFFVAVIVSSLFFVPSVDAAVFNSVPFTSQAPFGDWSEPWQNACEETAIIMIDSFYGGTYLNPNLARDLILKTLSLKESIYGTSLDETAEQMVGVINAFYPWEAYVVENPTLEQIKKELAFGRPLILPAYGNALANPFFRSEQLDYHVIVISGYDDVTGEFITQDPGTKHGLDLRYTFDTIMNAMHDYVIGKGNTKNGKKIAIFTRKELIDTAFSDGDGDGLFKKDEILQGTVLWLKDSDGDGYSDGEEVRFGYSPRLNENALTEGALVQSLSGPRVYILEKSFFGTLRKRHIVSEQVFLNNGWKWSDIILVSEKFLGRLGEGGVVN